MGRLPKTFNLLCAVVCLCFVGCGNYVSVTGTVTLTDGTPVTRGTVLFEDGAFSATGTIQSDGSFRMGTTREGSGIPPGSYSIAIMGASVTDVPEYDPSQVITGLGAASSGRPSVVTRDLVHRRYTHVLTSGLTVDVTRSMRHDIVVSPPD